ncbi:hypothetical protein HN51_045487 [Arachis hypogaea]
MGRASIRINGTECGTVSSDGKSKHQNRILSAVVMKASRAVLRWLWSFREKRSIVIQLHLHLHHAPGSKELQRAEVKRRRGANFGGRIGGSSKVMDGITEVAEASATAAGAKASAATRLTITEVVTAKSLPERKEDSRSVPT